MFNLTVTLVLFSLEYMHRKRYAHADIKGANILLGNEVTHDKEEVYLIDFGLAYLLPANPVEKPDPKAKHDGTVSLLFNFLTYGEN
jgi:vaccinia related kinase